MLDNKILITLVGLVATVFAINAVQNKNDELREDFGMLPSFTTKVDVQVAADAEDAQRGQFRSVQNTYKAMLNPQNSFYSVPGTFQSNIAPRFFAGDYGANITYNLPSRQNLAVPETPLGFANAVSDVKENFSTVEGNRTVPGCKPGGESLDYKGGAPLMQAGYADGNYNEKLNEVYDGPKAFKATRSSLPVGDMTTLNALGEKDQPIIYDRYMFANRNSFLRRNADKIRGDLAIAPNNSGWFNVSVQPNIDLEQGAMNVMGGVNNESAQKLADLMYTASGKSQTTFAGVNMAGELGNPTQRQYSSKRYSAYRTGNDNALNSVNMGTQYQTNLSAAGGDVQVSAYP